MSRLPLDQQILLVLQAIALAGLSVQMWLAGLQRTYVYFFTYLLIALLQTLVLGFMVPFDQPIYVQVWLATEGLIACFYALIVLELYGIVLRNLPSLASISRRYLRIALAAAILVSVMLLIFEQNAAGLTGHFLLFERAIVCSLLIFVLFITIFLVYYPVPLNRNVIVY